MTHWYVYHSQKTMGHSYASLGRSIVYSTKKQTKLCLGDVIWVVEGSANTPVSFALADCFKVTETDIPPFPFEYKAFELKAAGDKSLLPAQIALTTESTWFNDLHERFITKQRFFQSLSAEPGILTGLVATSGIAI
jgi:hypothetical protein